MKSTSYSKVSLILFAFVLMYFLVISQCLAGEKVQLENAYYRVEIDTVNGTIVRILDKAGGIDLAVMPEMADNFRLFVSGQGGAQNTIFGKDQKLSGLKQNADRLTLYWDGPLKSSEGSFHDIDVSLVIKLVDESVEFKLFLENKTDDKVADIWYPIVGGLQDFGADSSKETTLWLPIRSGWSVNLQEPFEPIVKFYPGNPGDMVMSFADIYCDQLNRGIYFSSQDIVARNKGYRFAKETDSGRTNITANIIHSPYTLPGKHFEGSNVVLRFHEGDWRDAGRFYRKWFEKNFGVMDPSRDWIRRQSFFLDIMFLLPEGNINYTFKDIPKLAKSAKDHGVDAFMISGWHRGGHDNGYPYYEPDPRLGTYDDLKAGIEQCHKMGVKVYFFVNYQVVMMNTQWYKDELNQYIEMKKDGTPMRTAGWGMGTLHARMGGFKRMAWIDPSFEPYSEALFKYFKKLIEIGADGLHIDKMVPSRANYNPKAPLSPDMSVWEGSLRLTERIYREGKKFNPDFAISFETAWDRVLQYGSGIWWVNNMSICKKFFPEMAETIMINQPYNYLGINDHVRKGNVILLAPLNTCRSMDWAPWKGISAYIKEVKRIRDELNDYVFLGEVLEQGQVKIEGELAASVKYNVFRNLKTGKRACVLTNKSMTSVKQKIVGFEGNRGGKVRIYVPFQKAVDADLPINVTIPPERIVFVVEGEKKSGDSDRQALSGGSEKPVTIHTPTKEPLPVIAGFDVEKSIKFENDLYRIEISRANGVITRIYDKLGGLDLIRETRLSNNFYFTLILDGKEEWENIEGNFIYGKEQKLTSVEQTKNRLVLSWNGPLVNYLGEPFDVSVTMRIEFVGDHVEFGMDIDNTSDHVIGEVYYPVLGGLMGLGDTYNGMKQTLFARHGGDPEKMFRVFWDHFQFGAHGPEQRYRYPDTASQPWMGFYLPKKNRSVYIGAHDTVEREKVLHLEMLPGTSGWPREDGNWPRPKELGGLPAGVLVKYVHIVNSPARQLYKATPVWLQFHDGDSSEGANIYKKWYESRQKNGS